MSRNYVLNTGNGVTLFVGSNQNVGFHTARPSEKLTFDEGNAKFNSNVYVMKRVGVNMSNPEVELDVTGDAHVTGDINIDGDMNIKNPISVNGFYVIRNSNQILKTHLSAAVKNMQVGTGGTVFALTNTSQEFNFVVTSNLTSIMRVPGAGPVNLYRPLMMSGDILPASNITYDIGSSNMRFRDLYLSGKTINLGDIKLTSESNALQIKNSNETAGFPLAVSELLLQDKGESYKFRNIGGQVAVFSVSNAIESIEPISTVPNIFLSNSNIGVGVQQPIAKFQVSEDSILSVARVGNFPLDKSLALFSHCNVAASSAYALMQSSIGDTYLNAGLGRAIRFRINNADVGMFSYSGRLGIGTTSPSCTLHVQSTDAVQIPSGTTGQRPGVPNAGHIRYNTTLNAYEGYGPGNAWGTLGGVKDTNQDTYIAPELVAGSNDDILRFYNSNVETMRLSQCNLDIRVPTVATADVYVMSNLGVGKSNPAEALDVKGSAKISSNLEVLGNMTVRGTTTMINSTTVNIADNVIQLNNGAAFTSTLQAGIEINRGDVTKSNYMFVFEEQSSAFKIGESGQLQCVATRDDTPPNYSVPYWNATAKKFNTVNSFAYVEGKLGVGTGLPIERLHVSGNAQVSSNLYVSSRLGVGNSNPFEAIDVIGNIEASQNIYAMNRMSVGHSNPTEAYDVIGNAKISSNAYVMRSLGIGTSNPSSNLHVVGTALVTGVLTTQAAVNAGGSILVTSSDPGPLIQTNYNQSATDNRYGIGQFANGQLRVYTAGSHNPATVSLSLAQASGAFEDLLTVRTNGKKVDINGPTQINANLLVTSNVGIGSINSSYRLHVQGDIYATSDVIGFSDKRYKDNITPIADALEIINSMQGCYYTRGSSSNVIKRHIGFMAQDLQEVLPEVVRYDASNDLYGVNYGNITALLCEGIKALHREIQALKEQKN